MTPLRATWDVPVSEADQLAARREAQHQASVATYASLRDATLHGWQAGIAEYRAGLVADPLAVLRVMGEALQALGASEETRLAFRLFGEQVADDVATARRGLDVDFSLRAHREGQG